MPVIYDPRRNRAKPAIYVSANGNVNVKPVDTSTVVNNSGKRERNTKILVGVLIGANVAVFVLWNSKLSRESHRLMLQHLCFSKINLLSGRWWTVLSHSVSHRELFHLALNMQSLWSSGVTIGKALGPAYIVGIYISSFPPHILGAIGSAAAHLILNKNPTALILGASGATFAMLTAMSVTLPKTIAKVPFLEQTVSIRTYAAVSVALEILLHATVSDGVSHAGHIGGAISGFLAGFAIKNLAKLNT